MLIEHIRPDGRAAHELRPVSFVPNFAPHATGSVLVRFGATQVICAATLEPKVPSWMYQQKVEGGWLTAEYSLLPYSTHDRKARDISRGRLDGRTVEIQRLIGRSLRAVVDLKKLPGFTLWVDCDVLQADGGTRTASITGAWVAARLAVNRLLAAGKLKEDPLSEPVAAVSAGIVAGKALLDLCYEEDRDAEVDANIVMTASGKLVEAQATGEESTFSRSQHDQMLDLASAGISELVKLQLAAARAT